MDIRGVISDIKFPETNIYYENDSADGFAFLGYARSKVGLDYDYCFEAISERNFCLNRSQTINKVITPTDNQYIYTIWSCVEFLLFINQFDAVDDLIKIVDGIGQYPNGMMRYCSTEVSIIVPNVTSAAALIYSMTGVQDKAEELVGVLRNTQIEGNWQYYNLRTNKYTRVEDSYHVAMMVYHLRETQKVSGIYTEDIVLKSVKCLKELNRKNLQSGSIGWGKPMLYIAIKGLDDELCVRSFNAIINESLDHSNFRVRAISAWALSKGGLYDN
jgi:hypothetical protein